MLIVLHALGCTETGTRRVLAELLSVAPLKGISLLVFTTHSTALSLKSDPRIVRSNQLVILGFPKPIFGIALRIPLEIIIALFSILPCVYTLNLSSYGLCLTKRYTLYFHSPLLLDLEAESGIHSGKPNIVKRLFLASCLRIRDQT
mgnify:CR=1 FL=1